MLIYISKVDFRVYQLVFLSVGSLPLKHLTYYDKDKGIVFERSGAFGPTQNLVEHKIDKNY